MRLRALLVLTALGALLGGCGPGSGGASSEVRLTATDDFGRETLIEQSPADTANTDTVMRVLQRYAEVDTRYGGGFVQAIDKVSAGRENGRQLDWFFYVNGVLADEGATATKINPGDRIWWDRHDWGVTNRVPAVVGSFPEPFLNGIDGDRLATRIECIEAVDDACDAVGERLSELGIIVGRALPGTEGGEENIRVVVGRWPTIQEDRAVAPLARGPQASGVFGRVEQGGRVLAVLDPRGRVVQRLGPGTGLVAATRFEDQAPTWIVTGTDAAGILSAARAVDETVLNEKFALAISQDRAVPLPAPAPR